MWLVGEDQLLRASEMPFVEKQLTARITVGELNFFACFIQRTWCIPGPMKVIA
jgi:hypothetical protein